MTRPIITVVGSFALGMTLRTQRMPIFGETLVGSDFDMGPGRKGSKSVLALLKLIRAAVCDSDAISPFHLPAV